MDYKINLSSLLSNVNVPDHFLRCGNMCTFHYGEITRYYDDIMDACVAVWGDEHNTNLGFITVYFQQSIQPMANTIPN